MFNPKQIHSPEVPFLGSRVPDLGRMSKPEVIGRRLD
jgi:hypothetical protein